MTALTTALSLFIKTLLIVIGLSAPKDCIKKNGSTISLYDINASIKGLRFISTQEDKQGKLYFDTPEGVLVYSNAVFSLLAPEEAHIREQWASNPTDLWFSMGWNRDGPYRFDGLNLFQHPIPKNTDYEAQANISNTLSYNPYGIYEIYTDSQSRIWFGTASMGIYRYDHKDLQWMYENELSNTPQGGSFGIRSILEDKENNYWINKADFKYADAQSNDITELISYEKMLGFPTTRNQYFLSMTRDKEDRIWMISYDSGIWLMNGEKIRHYPIKIDGQQIKLWNVMCDKKGKIWINSHKHGCFVFDGYSFLKVFQE